jgi:hypothetical protein
MATFLANFAIVDDGVYAGQSVSARDTSTVGMLPSDFVIDGNVDASEIDPSNYTVTRITKHQWTTSDGFFYGGDEFSHVFKESGQKQVQLKVWSEQFITDDGRTFYFTHTTFQDFEIKSRFLKILLDSNPTWELLDFSETLDFYKSAAKFFERIHNDTRGIFDLWDARKINPKFFEYLSLTLGHESVYSQKVGYSPELDSKFSDYNIYDRIKNNAATDSEISAFRRFLLMSAQLFRNKGTPANIESFLSLFSIDGKAIELWTQTWGQTPIGIINENFIGFDLTENKIGLAWDNLRAVGNSNERGFINKTLNGIIINNFHKTEWFEYDVDSVGTNDSGWTEFELAEPSSYFRDIYTSNGGLLVDRDEYKTEPLVYDLVANNPVRSDSSKPTILQIAPDTLEFGDRFAVSYHKYQLNSNGEASNVDSMLATRESSYSNLDVSVKFKFIKPNDPNTIEAFRFPENEVFVGLRGIPKSDDLYAHFTEYYRIGINGRRSTVSVSKVVKGISIEDAIYQKINLSGDKENPVYDLVFTLPVDSSECLTEEELNEVECVPFSVDYNKVYELLVQLNGSLLNVSIRENDEETDIKNNIDSDTGGSEYGIESSNEFTKILDSLDLDVGNESVLSLDVDGNEIISSTYQYNETGGNIGIGTKSSIIEIREIELNILDPDETLYTTSEKEFNLKPRYLEWLGQSLLRFNSNRENKETFSGTISPVFDPSVSDYSVEASSDALQFIFFDGITLNESVSTRYNVTFDKNWMETTFTDSNDLLSRVIVPIGKQKMWFMTDQRPLPKSLYKNINGGTETQTPSPTGSNESVQLPGLWQYNLSTVLDNYDLKPDDMFSTLIRNEGTTTEYSNTFSWSEKLCQYTLSNKPLAYKGIFQEVVPYSTTFSQLGDRVLIADGSTYNNPVFLPITYTAAGGRRLVGVRFKNCDDIERLISALRTDLSVDVQLWGDYTFELSEESVKFRPDREELPKSTTPGHVLARVFLPLGVLDTNRRTYSLSTEYLHDVTNSGSSSIRMNGVYVRIPREKTYFRESSNTVELFSETLNPYEDKIQGLQCRHFMSAAVYLGSSLQPFDYGNEFPNTYIMDSGIRSMLDSLGKKAQKEENYSCESCLDTYNYEDDVEWWLPSEVWYKRRFVKQPFDLSSDILSNINYRSSDSFNKFFYNVKIEAGSIKPKALTFLLTDGPINTNTMYYAKVNVRIDYMGFNYSQIDEPEQRNNAINQSEKAKLSIIGGKRATYTDYSQSPSGSCLTFYVPISWYPDLGRPGDNTIEWFNYIVGSSGTGSTSPSVTITPIGLMTLLMNESGESNSFQLTSNSQNANLLLDITKDWTIEEWNSLFESHVDVEFIAERVPANKYKLYDKLSLIPDYDTNVGAYIDVLFNVADPDSIDWEVLDTFRIYVRSRDQQVFEVPNELKSIRSWIQGVKSSSLNNLIVNKDKYDLVSKSLIRLKSDPIFNTFGGAHLQGRWFFDIFFEGSTITSKIEDDFNPNKRREINWLPYESDEEDIFSTALRRASTNLVFNSSDLTYELVNVQGESSFKSLNLNTSLDVDYLKSGEVMIDENVVQFTKSEEPNIKKLYMVDENNVILDMEATVLFDTALDSIKNFQGKKFELILKATNIYDPIRKKNVLGGYYFLGIGTYNFDIGLGVARYNLDTGEMEKSFLGGFGDFNVRGVKTGVWYNLRAIVTSEVIRIIFNESRDSDRLVLNYNISPLIHEDPNRYLSGNFEELVYIVSGLQNLDITYPDKLGERSSTDYLQKNFNEELVKEYRPAGNRAGMVFYNDYTYVGKVTYISQIPNNKTFGDSHDKTDKSYIINELRQSFGETGSIDYIGRTANGTEVIKVGDKLYYKLFKKPLNLYDNDIQFVTIENNNVIVQYGASRRFDVIIVSEDFYSYKSIYVKDDTFHLDHLYKYLEFTDRRVRNIWTGENLVHIDFEDLES